MKQNTIDLIIFTALKKFDDNKFYSTNDTLLVNTLKQHLRNTYKKATGRRIKDRELNYMLRRINKSLHEKVNTAVVLPEQPAVEGQPQV